MREHDLVNHPLGYVPVPQETFAISFTTLAEVIAWNRECEHRAAGDRLAASIRRGDE